MVLVLALLTALSCGPHRSGRFFDPETPGTLLLPPSSVYCGTAYGLRIYSAPVDGGRFAGSMDFVRTDCPDMGVATEAVREAAQGVPITLQEVESFRLAIDDGSTFMDPDGKWVWSLSDGYTILAHSWSWKRALGPSFRRSAYHLTERSR